MNQISIKLPKEDKLALELAAARRRISLAELNRRIVTEWLNKNVRRPKKGA